MSRSLKAHLLLVMVTFFWGATFVVVKNALADVSPLLFNALRMTLAAVILGALFFRGWGGYSRATLLAGARVGIFLWLGYEFQTTGLQLTTPSKSAFLTGVSVVLVPVFLALFWRRKISNWTTAGVITAFAGLFLLTVPGGAGGLGNWASVNRGDALTMGCAVAFGFQIIFMGRATREHDFRQIAFLQAATAAVAMLLTLPLAGNNYITWTPRALWAIGITAVLCTAAAFTIQAWAQQFTPATHTALIFALEPVFAWITSYLVLGEHLGMRATIGALLILAGILVAELKAAPEAPPGAASFSPA